MVETPAKLWWRDIDRETGVDQSDIDFDISLEGLQITLEEAGEGENESKNPQMAPSE